ncbi:MAG: hemerythrin domain-containing protein [Candidatus Dormibacter sp.]
MDSKDVTSSTAASGTVEQLIACEHAAIRAHLAYLREFAVILPALDEATTSSRTAAILDFLTTGLLPHAATEEAVLYPAIETLIGAGSTRTMTLDHAAITDLVTELATVVSGHQDPAARAEAQRLLLVLDGLVSTHLWKEDTVYVPLLAGLDPAAYTALHAGIAAHAGHQVHGH